jgi:hypothetical protein
MNLNSLVMTKVRPTVVFDPKNKEHRFHAYNLLKNRTLKNCPYIWALTSGSDNVYDMLMHELSLYYTEQEFGVAAEPHKENVVALQVDRKAG